MNEFKKFCLLMMLNVLVEGSRRIWLQHTGVSNKANWREDVKGCNGLFFDPNTQGEMTMDSMTVRRMVLPVDGTIRLNYGAKVIFDEADEKCISLKPVERLSWVDPRNWSPLKNNAVPDVEQIPCSYDEIVLPVNNSFSVVDTPRRVFAIAVEINGKKHTRVGSPRSIIVAGLTAFVLTINNCSPGFGCRCMNDEILDVPKLCDFVRSYRKNAVGCQRPFTARGFCTTVCGIHITIVAVSNMKNERIVYFLKSRSDYVDYYISKRANWAFKYDVFVMDKGNAGDGYYAAEILPELKRILQEDLHNEIISNYSIISSGEAIRTRQVLEVTFGIIFGALLVTLLFFVTIFVVYVQLPIKYSYEVKWPSAGRKLRPFLFARFDNREDGEMTFERGSDVGLEKSFQNPLYGTDMPSTSAEYFQVRAGTEDEGEEADEDGMQRRMFDGMEAMEIESLHGEMQK